MELAVLQVKMELAVLREHQVKTEQAEPVDMTELNQVTMVILMVKFMDRLLVNYILMQVVEFLNGMVMNGFLSKT